MTTEVPIEQILDCVSIATHQHCGDAEIHTLATACFVLLNEYCWRQRLWTAHGAAIKQFAGDIKDATQCARLHKALCVIKTGSILGLKNRHFTKFRETDERLQRLTKHDILARHLGFNGERISNLRIALMTTVTDVQDLQMECHREIICTTRCSWHIASKRCWKAG